MTVAEHGVSSNTPERYIFGAGAVYINWTNVSTPGILLGATLGGNSLEIIRTYRDIRPDGSKGKVKGFRRIQEVTARLTVNLFEITEANLLYMLPGASASTHVITGGEIDDNDYHTVAWVAEHTGFTMSSAPIIVKLSNALAEMPFKIDAKNNEEGVVQVVFEAHFADSDLDTEPWEITYPSS